MQMYIAKIKEIVYDYHRPLTDESILKWINQFDQNDRIDLLSEVVNILEKTYISEESAERILSEFIDHLLLNFFEQNLENLINNSTFLSCQAIYKSQSILLNKLKILFSKRFDAEISFNDLSKKYLIYIDDNLSSGGTFTKDIKKLVEEISWDLFIQQDKRIIPFFFYLHNWGYNNSKYSLNSQYRGIQNKINFICHYQIENNPRINAYNREPKFNHAYIKDENDLRVHTYLDNLTNRTRNYQMKNIEYAFRPENLPNTESFFTSVAARDRYEKIILNKGLDIIERISSCSDSTRPLGFTSPSHQTLGLGSHVFTWRNTSNTCPIIYWWESNGWSPLLPVQNRGQN